MICALDGVEALRYARKEHADLILLDLLLPKTPGIEVLARLKKDHETSDIPVVVSSGLSEKNREKRLAAGADYLEKSMLMPDKGINLLPKISTDVVCRINRKRGVAFSQVPTSPGQ